MPADTAVAASAVPVGTAADIAVYFVVDLGIAVEEPDYKAADIEAAQAAAVPCIPDFLSRRPGRIPYSP